MKIEATQPKDEFEAIPPGRYAVRILNAEPYVSKSGKNMLKWVLKINGHKKFDNRELIVSTVYQGQNPWFLQKLMQAANPDAGIVFDNGKMIFDTEDFIGKVMEVELDYPIDASGVQSKYYRVKEFYPYVSDITDFANFKP